MSFPTKTSQPIAITSRSNHDLSAPHITTMDFMQLSVSKAIELVPKQTIDVEHRCFSRLEPLVVPTFGKANIQHRAFFVPFRTCWRAFDDMMNDVPHVFDNGETSIPTHVPLITNEEFVKVFIDDHEDFAVPTSSRQYDFRYTVHGSDGSVTSSNTYNFTYMGRLAYKLLRQLGYQITFSSLHNLEYHSAMPLLSLGRIYVDYYYPSQYANDGDSAFVLSLLQSNGAVSGTSFLNAVDIKRLLSIFAHVAYDSDYFTSAWDNPSAPNDGLASSMSINDVNNTEAYVSNSVEYGLDDGSQAPFITNTSEGFLTPISQFALNALRSMSDYLRRNQIAGSRILDRYLARFGVKLPEANLNRSVKTGDFAQHIDIGDVTSTADTGSTVLGDYAGKGASYGVGSYQFTATERGMFIVITTIQPTAYNYQGINRHTKHLTKLDFWTPEFDNLGTQALACNEVYAPINGDETFSGYDQKVFGFVPRYSEYKVPYAQITGDIILGSRSVGEESWTLFRDMKPYIDAVGIENFVHDYDFVMGTDANQYNRIFYNVENTADHFRVSHYFDIKSSFPGKSLFDTYEYKDEDKAEKVTLNVNGTTNN